MKMCKKCSTCIGNTICEILTYPNNGQCDIFIKLVEEKFKSTNKQSTKLCRSCIKLWPCVAAGENIETCDCYESMA